MESDGYCHDTRNYHKKRGAALYSSISTYLCSAGKEAFRSVKIESGLVDVPTNGSSNGFSAKCYDFKRERCFYEQICQDFMQPITTYCTKYLKNTRHVYTAPGHVGQILRRFTRKRTEKVLLYLKELGSNSNVSNASAVLCRGGKRYNAGKKSTFQAMKRIDTPYNTWEMRRDVNATQYVKFGVKPIRREDGLWRRL